ncbi:MAG: hypothetical protein QXE12_03950 [Conexivisphaerales archaeon]
MTSEDKLFTISLKEAKNTSPNKRTKRGIRLLKYKMARILKVKSDEVRISTNLNEWIWRRGKNLSFSRLRVKISKEDDNIYIKLPTESSETVTKGETQGNVENTQSDRHTE